LEVVLLRLSEYVTKNGAFGSLKDGKTERGEAIPLQAWTGLYCCRRLMRPEFPEGQHMKVARLSGLGTGHLYAQDISLVSFPLEAESTSGP
jgi:hypothetical protein